LMDLNSLDRLAAALPCGYSPSTAPATEPTALAAMAMLAHDRRDAAQPALVWLAELQSHDGSLGINKRETSPCWPTGLAVLAWSLAPDEFQGNIERATAWLLDARGKPQPRSPQMGHDSTLIGWPWVLGTHSWIEPTAFNVLALKAAGRAQHPRTREAVRLLVDRLLPTGGCNYGNTTVLGQTLRPHLAPTGLVLLALACEDLNDTRVANSLDYLEQELSLRTSCTSLCYGLMGLAAHGRFPHSAASWLKAACKRLEERHPGDWKLALIALAALGDRCPLIQHAAVGA
jgi:hypothetical protein